MVSASIDICFFSSKSSELHLSRCFDNYSQAVEWYNIVLRDLIVSRISSISFFVDLSLS